jgi:protein required for attachment to host cells
MRQPRIWLLVADGGTAMVFSSYAAQAPGGARLHALPGGSFRRKSRVKHSGEKPGRSMASPATGIIHGGPSREDDERDAEDNFITDVLAWLVAPGNMMQFDHLIIAAPPRPLGSLRAAMPKKLAAKVLKEIRADLIKAPIKDIERRIAGQLNRVQAASEIRH